MRLFPARLHVILASAAPTAVVFRRGPANSVCTVGWNRQTDQFELGQWLHGRIYERRADLSPDGRYMIYFARGGRRHDETKGTWTAISRTPWLQAITLFGKGDCWQGGGLFTDTNRYWLNGCHFVVRESPEMQEDTTYIPPGHFGAECPSVYYRRLLRDGWVLELRSDSAAVPHCTVFAKDLPCGWVLRKFAYAAVQHPVGTGVYWDEHEMQNVERNLLISMPRCEWADRDGTSLVWAEAGILYRSEIDLAGLTNRRKLFDFNAMTFQALTAPY